TYFVVAHFHYVLFGGSIFAILGAIYYWFPKMFGRMLNDKLGQVQFWLTLIGFNVTFFPMHFLGVDGMPRRIYTYPDGMGWNTWNFVETLGAYLLGFSVLLLFVNMFVSLRQGVVAPADPWDGRTLEWSIPSPPPAYNFAVVPTVEARDEFWHEKYGKAKVTKEQRVANETGNPHGHAIHLPPPSYFPVLAALGLALLAGGLIYTPVMSVVGGVLLVVSLYGWAFEPIH
ncbi:MAG: cytochrome c oxidase subunit 4, partial [Thermomicrobiaceae bacterium]|nr:cytochrome c oxidase subunit 4 [Thermomicrobiaceae bacterium]